MWCDGGYGGRLSCGVMVEEICHRPSSTLTAHSSSVLSRHRKSLEGKRPGWGKGACRIDHWIHPLDEIDV